MSPTVASLPRKFAISLARFIVSFILLLTIVGCQKKTELPSRVQDFQLIDHRGEALQLSKLTHPLVLAPNLTPQQAKALAQSLGQLSNRPKLAVLRERPDLAVSQNQRPSSWPPKVRVLIDPSLVVTESLGLRSKDEVICLSPTGEVLYLGAQQGLKKGIGQSPASWKRGNGQALLHAGLPSFTYSQDIAPILAEKCLSCHRRGQIAPFALDNFKAVKQRTKMIREVVMTGRMPPWNVTSTSVSLRQNHALTPTQKRALISWIDAGATEGPEQDPLPSFLKQIEAQTTTLTPPANRVLEASREVKVPADGQLDYEYLALDPQIDRDVYIQAMHFEPGDARAVHHAAVLAHTGQLGEKPSTADYLKYELMTFDPLSYHPLNLSKESGVEDAAFLLPKGSKLIVELHLTPYGKQTSFRPKLSLSFSNSKPKNILKRKSFLNPNIEIPAGAEHHVETAECLIEEPATLVGLFPHMHYRGKAASFQINGKEFLGIPNYDFNWQFAYWLAKEKKLTTGTRVSIRGIFDNSENNPVNPDPKKTVRFGAQSQDEMLYGALWLKTSEASE